MLNSFGIYELYIVEFVFSRVFIIRQNAVIFLRYVIANGLEIGYTISIALYIYDLLEDSIRYA